MEDKLKEIINHYGLRNQLRKLNEETYELIEAVMNFETGDKLNYTEEQMLEHIGAIAEEIADNLILLKQFKYFYNIKKEDIEKVVNYKIQRTLERIESGYYGN